MRKIFLMIIVLTITGLTSEILAQKVVSNHRVGNTTYLAVIDNGTLLKAAIKTPAELSSQKIDGKMKSHNHNSEINKKVSYKFAVAKNDLSSTMNWNEAYDTGCPTYSESSGDIGSWRLPTQRELMLIYQMQSELEAINSFDHFVSNNYWSSTESSSSNSGYVNFGTGYVSSYFKGTDYRVRCIRDL